MIALLRRELRRLAIYGGAVCAGTLLCLLVAIDRDFDVNGAFALSLLVGAGLIGVATVAPDTDSGAVAFFARLPISPWRLLAAKVVAASLWTVAAFVPHIFVISAGTTRDVLRAPMPAFTVYAFASAVLASVAMRRALPAALVTPLIALGAFCLTWLPPALLFDVGVGSHEVSTLTYAFSASFILLGAVAFAHGDRHRASPRAPLIAAGGAFAISLVALGGIATAHELAAREAPHWMTVRDSVVESLDGRKVAIGLGGSRWSDTEARVAVVDRVDGGAWLMPLRNVTALAFAPDGRHLLVRRNGREGGWLVDVETRRAEPRLAAFRDAYQGFGSPHILWRSAEPFFAWLVDDKLEVHAAGGRAVASLAVRPGVRIAGTSGERVFLAEEGALVAIAPWSGARERIAAPDGFRVEDALVGPRGRRAVLVGDVGGRKRVALVDIETRHAVVAATELEGSTSIELCRFSPDETAVAVVRDAVGRVAIALVDAGGRVRDSSIAGSEIEASVMAEHAVWSADGRELVLPWGAVVDAETGAERKSASGVVAVAGRGAAVVLGRPFAFVDLTSGAVVARPFEEK